MNIKKENIKKALALLEAKKFVIDAAFLSLIEQAENGNKQACFKLCSGFTGDSPGYPADYQMAMYYIEKLKKSWSYKLNSRRYFNILYHDALIECRFNRYEQAIKKYAIALKYMVKKLPQDEWDYDFFNAVNDANYFYQRSLQPLSA